MLCVFCGKQMLEMGSSNEISCKNDNCAVEFYGVFEKHNTINICLPLTIHMTSCDKNIPMQILINYFSENCLILLEKEEVFKEYLESLLSYKDIYTMVTDSSKSIEILDKVKRICERLYIHRAIW